MYLKQKQKLVRDKRQLKRWLLLLKNKKVGYLKIVKINFKRKFTLIDKIKQKIECLKKNFIKKKTKTNFCFVFKILLNNDLNERKKLKMINQTTIKIKKKIN